MKHCTSPDRPARRVAGVLAVTLTTTGLVALSGAEAGAADPAFSGYNSGTLATPVRVEIYEPTIPIPAEPQAELSLGFSSVEAATGGARSRASLLWPGAPVGEGFKVIADTIGLPPEIGEQGYPVQANAAHPQGPPEEVKQPFPGAVMRTAATASGASSSTGFSGDCDVRPGETDSSCPLPAMLAAVVDVSGSAASGTAESTSGKVVATARAEADGVSMLEGLLVVSGVSSEVTSTTDGRTPEGKAAATYATLTLDGQPISLGPDGVVVPGQEIDVPGLPEDAAAALGALGITLTVPQPSYEREGSQLVSTVAALVVDIDSGVLRRKLDVLPLRDVAEAIPDPAGDARNLLGAALNLSPRYVITLAATRASVNTAQGIEFPTLPPLTDLEPLAAAPAPDLGSEVLPELSTDVDFGAAPAPVADPATGLPVLTSTRALDVPPLPGIPTVLLLAAALLTGGAAAGLRWLSGFVLGAAGKGLCQHGLDSGLPDLRKA